MGNIDVFENIYITLEKVAGQVNLPQKFIRQQTENGKIPHLIVGRWLRYKLKSVLVALEEIEQESIKPKLGKKLTGELVKRS